MSATASPAPPPTDTSSPRRTNDVLGRLPQLLDYLTRSLRRAEPGEHYDDRGRDPAHALCVAHGHIEDARGFVTALAEQLHAAHNHLSHLGRHSTED